ncbi:Gar1/Naf1 RNA Hypothetical protein region [Nesidiocoris tenuis]|uniref:H/ACA ribonucleoprotein complex non-core subunit NAF1 n=1 Tax=Nesidiocoris tenuis TaxID=355587 RepID=A0ABN7AN07_9HEMI|nr:Gar1/Naf1 RNA Hypothetical protein region [Nesidiocoris tenuis]
MEEAEASSSTHIDGSADAKNSQSQSNDPPKSSDASGSTQVEESPTSDPIGSMKSFQSSSADANAEPDSKSELAMSPREAEIESEPVPKSEDSPLTSSATPVEKQVAGVLMTESDKTGGEHSASEESVMYANVASVLASKVIEINKTARESSEDLQQSKKPSLKRKNDSLSLIMSYEGGSSSSSDEETEKENEGDQFREHRYQTISISSDSDEDVVEVVEPVQNGEKSSDDDDEDEETDHGSGNENNSNSESEAGRGTADGDCSEARSQPDKAKARRNKALTDPLMLDYLPPIEKLTISVPEEECVPVGKVYSIVDRLVVIESLPNTPPLMLDSVIFTKNGQPIGQIFDIFGHVKRPFYSIRFNKPEEIQSSEVSIGVLVYCAPQTDHTKYVFTKDFVREKGSDASWEHDEEPPPSAMEYSDDEAERAAKQKIKVKKEKDVDSPARRRHLSFEKLMNRNNTLRNRAFKRDIQGEARGNWDVGWHNYKRSQAPVTLPGGAVSYDSPPPPPPPRAQQQILGPPLPCVFPGSGNRPPLGATVNPMNLVIRPPCFNPVIDRPPPPPPFIGSPPPPIGAPTWARFEPPPTPPPRSFASPNYVHSPPPGPGPFPPPPPPRMFAPFGRLSTAFSYASPPPIAMSSPPPAGASGGIPPFPTGYHPHGHHHRPHHPPGAGFHHGPNAFHHQAPHHNHHQGPHHAPHHSPHQAPHHSPHQAPHHSPHQAASSLFPRRPDHKPF